MLDYLTDMINDVTDWLHGYAAANFEEERETLDLEEALRETLWDDSDCPEPPTTTFRHVVLKEAEKCVLKDRNAQYGPPEDSFETIAKFWSLYIDEFVYRRRLTGVDVGNMMILMKMCRNQHSPKLDNWIDIAGYAACAAEIENKYVPVLDNDKI